jgi:anti-sigma factor RsiW
MSRQEKITDTELNAYLDGELSEEERRAVESRLAGDPESARRVAELTRIDDAIRARYAPVLDEPLPERMQATLSGSSARISQGPWMRAAAAVLLLLLGGGAGYLVRGLVEQPEAQVARLVNFAVKAHAVYTPEVLHPVEVGASEEAHLVKWLTKRLGANVRAPALSAQGFKLLGGRLLPHPDGPAAQFMYENGQGRRLTLYVRRVAATEDTAFQFATSGGHSAFYWIDRPLAYALVGELPRDQLLTIARLTYEQLN